MVTTVNIPLHIFPTRYNSTQFIYSLKTALHVSGGISTHHQEHIQLYLQYLVLVNRYYYLPLFWESWSWSECSVGTVPISDLRHRSVNISLHKIPTRCNSTQFIYFWKAALHISGGISNHH